MSLEVVAYEYEFYGNETKIAQRKWGTLDLLQEEKININITKEIKTMYVINI